MLSKVLLTAKLSQERCCSVLLFPLGAPIPNYRTLEIQETCNHRQELCQLFPLSHRGYGSISLYKLRVSTTQIIYMCHWRWKLSLWCFPESEGRGFREHLLGKWQFYSRYWSTTLGEPHLHGQILHSAGWPSNLIWDFKADSELMIEIQQCCLSQCRGLAWQSAPPWDPASSWFCCMRARETFRGSTKLARSSETKKVWASVTVQEGMLSKHNPGFWMRSWNRKRMSYKNFGNLKC